MHGESDEPISLSFVDCMSCGLAAALFLFLVFAAIPRATPLATAAAQIDEGGAISGGAAAQLPPLFIGDGNIVPVDIRVEFETGPIRKATVIWEGSPNLIQSNYQPSPGLVSVAMVSLRSHVPLPTLIFVGETQRISGQITINAGGASRQMRFDCLPVESGGRLQVLGFDGGTPIEGCAR